MNCRICDLELFDKDIVDESSFGEDNEFHKLYRCPRCFNIHEVDL